MVITKKNVLFEWSVDIIKIKQSFYFNVSFILWTIKKFNICWFHQSILTNINWNDKFQLILTFSKIDLFIFVLWKDVGQWKERERKKENVRPLISRATFCDGGRAFESHLKRWSVSNEIGAKWRSDTRTNRQTVQTCGPSKAKLIWMMGHCLPTHQMHWSDQKQKEKKNKKQNIKTKNL